MAAAQKIKDKTPQTEPNFAKVHSDVRAAEMQLTVAQDVLRNARTTMARKELERKYITASFPANISYEVYNLAWQQNTMDNPSQPVDGASGAEKYYEGFAKIAQKCYRAGSTTDRVGVSTKNLGDQPVEKLRKEVLEAEEKFVRLKR